MKAIIKEQGHTYTYYRVNNIKIDNDTNSFIINYQDKDDEECEEISLISPDFNLQLTMDKLEQSDEFKVGDEVYVPLFNRNAIITSLLYTCAGCKRASIIFLDGHRACFDTNDLHKTGRNFSEVEDAKRALQEMENYSIKMVTNAKDAENYPISEDISKSIEEINKLIFENGQVESEKKYERTCN